MADLDGMFTELIYDADIRPFIEENFPNAKFEDASDEIHEGRFEVILPEDEKDEFYCQMLLHGMTDSCFVFQLMLLSSDAEEHAKIREWLQMVRDET